MMISGKFEEVTGSSLEPKKSGMRQQVESVWKSNLAVFIGFTVLCSVVYLPVGAGHGSLKTNGPWPNGGLFTGDPIAGGPITMPLETLVNYAWSHFTFPIVDPFQAFGIPLLATQSAAVFLPEVVMHLMFPANYSLWNVLRLVLMSFGTYLFAKSIGQRRGGAVAAGIAASLVGVAPPNINLEMLNPITVLPYLLLSLRYLVDPEAKRLAYYFLGFTTSVTGLAISGFQEELPLLFAVTGAYLLAMVMKFKTFLRAPSRLLLTVLAGLIGLVIGGVGVLPTLQAVSQGMGVNGNSSYLSAVPHYWLATLVIPNIAGTGITAQPSDFGQTVWILGTPVFALVVFMTMVAMTKRHIEGLWYVIPSLLITATGVLGYADLFGILRIFDFFPFNAILMIRFLQFGWWVGFCLILGYMISNAVRLNWYDLLVCVLFSLVADWVLYRVYAKQLVAGHLDVANAQHATAVAMVIVFAFAVAVFVSRKTHSSYVIVGVFLMATLFYLPRNFFSPYGSTAISTISNTRLTNGRTLQFDNGFLQLPWKDFSSQVFGPISSSSFDSIIGALVPASATADGQNGAYGIAPSMYFVKMEPHFIQVLRFLGVNEIASTSPIPIIGNKRVQSCNTSQRSTGSSLSLGVCYSGVGVVHGGPPTKAYLYMISKTDPIVASFKRYIKTNSTKSAIDMAISQISKSNLTGPMLENAYITHITGVTHDQLIQAKDVYGLSKSANTETVAVRLYARTPGFVTLRDSYLPGLQVNIDGKPSDAYPVDGGLWTAVKVPSGRSTVHLNYLSNTVAVEFVVFFGGTFLLVIAWATLAYRDISQRIRRFMDGSTSRGR